MKARVEEILTQSDITKKRANEFESLVNELSKQLDELSDQMTDQMKRNTMLESIIETQKLKIEELQQENLDKQIAQKFVSKNQGDMQKMIKIYKDKIIEWQTKMQEKHTETSSLKQQKANDQKTILLMRREIQRLNSELKMSSLRYNNSKQEMQNLTRAIAAREETIKLLKREIERLRNLLSKQEPLKQNLRVIDQMKRETDAKISKARQDLQKVQQNATRLSTTPATTRYFEQLLERHQRTLARLEKQRQDMKNAEMHSRMLCLDAVSHLVKENELQIPEEVVLKYMPKPEPSRKVQAMAEKRRHEPDIPLPEVSVKPKYAPNQQSYAEQLEILGSLANQVEPSALKGILREARHRQIIVPTQTKKTSRSTNGDLPSLFVRSNRK